VNDWYQADYYRVSPSRNLQGPATGEQGARVLRGGSWDYTYLGATRSAYRFNFWPGNWLYYLGGFRCARSP
jgi:formylglycine-generating enzyme required for sulfatase activity